MLNLAEFKTDVEDGHISDFKRFICNQETSEFAKINQSNVTKLTTTNWHYQLALYTLIIVNLIQVGLFWEIKHELMILLNAEDP